MPSGRIGVRMRAEQGRDDFGRFESAIESGLHATVMETAAIGANAARAAAPERTGRLRQSIQVKMLGALTAMFTANVPYAVFQDEGTGPKGAEGQFLTNREDFWAIGPVGGTPASHFMLAGIQAVRAALPGVLASNMP